MKKSIAIAAALMLLSHASQAAEKSINKPLKSLCTSDNKFDPNDLSFQRAQKVFEMMKEYERQSCGVRGDDYISFLSQKYQSRIDGY